MTTPSIITILVSWNITEIHMSSKKRAFAWIPGLALTGTQFVSLREPFLVISCRVVNPDQIGEQSLHQQTLRQQTTLIFPHQELSISYTELWLPDNQDDS